MRLLTTSFIAVLSASACSCPSSSSNDAAAAAPVAPAALQGEYKNDRGSALVIDAVDAAGHFHGSFRSAVGRVDAGQAFPVSGIANGDVVGFSVAFGKAGSVASWTGQLDGDALVTSWHLSRNVEDDAEANDLWSSTLSGADTFRRVR